MAETIETLVGWMLDQASKQRDGAPASSVRMSHQNADATFSEIGTYDLPIERTELEISELVARIYKEGSEHAAHFPTPQVYSLALIWQQEGRQTSGASKLMRHAGAPMDGKLSPTEAPNTVGLISQQMRHTEAQARINSLLVEKFARLLVEDNDRKTKRIEVLEAARAAQLDTLEKIALRQHEIKVEELREERSQKRLDDGLQNLKLLAPPIIATIVKKLGGPSIPTQDPELINLKVWLKSLNEAQLTSLLASSTPGQQSAILHAYKQLAMADEPGFADLAKEEPPKAPIQ